MSCAKNSSAPPEPPGISFMNVILIGYRGSGKSTVARILGERLQQPWLDADDAIEQAAGKSIKQIFAEDGEAVFRDIESRVVAELAAREDVVLALGGGAVLREENRRAIAGRGRIIWLRAAAQALHERISADAATGQRRPDLTASGGYDEIERLLRQREPIYRGCAELAVDTEGRTPEKIADEILAALSTA